MPSATSPPLLVARHLPRREVRAREQRVVVEHLLEVRHEPDRVDRVAVEAAAELVVDAAVGHAPQRAQRHRERLLAAAAAVHAQQEREHASAAGTWAPGRSRRCARRAARAASAGRRAASPRVSRKPAGGRAEPALLQARGHLRGLVLDHARGARGRPRRCPRAPAGTRAARRAPRAGSTSRRRTGGRRAAGRPSSASRPGRSARRPRVM